MKQETADETRSAGGWVRDANGGHVAYPGIYAVAIVDSKAPAFGSARLHEVDFKLNEATPAQAKSRAINRLNAIFAK